MSDIRYNQWLHNSGTGGVSQDAGGNIGIGTTAPLIPVGAGNTTILNVGVVTANYIYGTVQGAIEGTLDDWIVHAGDTNTKFGFPAADTFTVETAGDERLRIDSTGKVGVGANPTAYPGKFVVSGDALICDRDIHSRVANSVANSDRGFKQDIDGVEKLHLYTDNSNNIILEGNGGAEKLRINNGGSVGIGTDGPDSKLHVHNGAFRVTNTAKTNVVEISTDGNIEVRRTGGSAYIDFSDNTTNDADCRIQHVSDGFEFSTGGQGSRTTKLKIDSSGRVHIGGVTGPNSAKLFVSGTNSTSYVTLRNTSAGDGSGARWNSIRFQGTQSGGEVSDLVQLQANHDGTADDEKGSFQVLVNDGNDGDSLQERLRIDSSGRLLMGTTTPYAGANMEIRSTDSGGDTQLRITNNATAANTKAGIVFTTSTGDYASGSIRYERDAGLAQGSGGNMGKYDAMIISAFAGSQADPWGSLEQNGVYIWGQSGTGSGGLNQSVGIGTDMPPQNTNSSSPNSNGPLLVCAPEGGNALTLLARTPTPAGNDDVIGLNFAARNYFGTTGRSGLTYQIVCQNGHGSYGDRGQLRFNPGYDGDSNNDGKGMVMEFQGHFRPTHDNAQNLGSGSLRWNTIYAANTSINNSDINLKQNIVGLSTAEMNAAGRISKIFKTYRWKESVEEKGIDKARIHTGVVAQTVKAELEAEGLDPSKYAFYCQDTGWYKDGVLLGDGITHGPGVYDKLNDETPSTVGFTSSTTYAIRYVELLSFIAAYNEQRFTSLEARVSALEGS